MSGSEGPESSGSLHDLPVSEFLARVASRQPAPGGGAVAGTTVAAAAALVAMAARYSDDLPEGSTMAERADNLRRRAADLTDADAEAYTAVLAAYRASREDQESRLGGIRAALEVASDIPLAMAGCAKEIGDLGVRVATEGNQNLRGDAVTAVLLAEAAARSAAYLVQLNAELGELGHDRPERAEACCAALRDAVQAVGGRT